jgi:hypothetical protein
VAHARRGVSAGATVAEGEEAFNKEPTVRSKLAFCLLLAACVDSGATSSDVSSNLEQPNGGETTTDEAPMFGEQPEFEAATIENDAAYSDPTPIADLQSAASHRIVIAWGKLPADPNSVARDWSGQLQISRGALVVGRTIGFEDATDHVLPRASRDIVSFQSITKPFVDGLALRVLDPDPASTDPLTLTYTAASGGATYSIDLAQLASGPLVVDAGDGFKIVAAAVRDQDCEHGFMRGRFHQVAPNLGVFRGLVVGPDGGVIGHVRGIYGQKKDGTKALFGKFIDDAGHFKGIMAGTYGDGSFEAKWLVASGAHGRIVGKYFDSPDVRGGLFIARWADSTCAQ